MKLPRLVVLIGGSGTNLQAIIDAIAKKKLTMEIAAVISHRKDVLGLKRAQKAAIPALTIDHKLYTKREDFEKDLIAAIEPFNPDWLALAGFMRVLTKDFINLYEGKLLNVHPSLLPKYKGLNTHQRVLEAKEKEHGSSIHFVTKELDGGPIIANARFPILKTDTPQSLQKRALTIEHWLYPEVLSWAANSRLAYHNKSAILDNAPIAPMGVQFNHQLIKES